MKRKLGKRGASDSPTQPKFASLLQQQHHHGVWQPRVQGNMRGGGGGFRGGSWRGPRMPNNRGPRRFWGNRGRGGPSRFPYDNIQQFNQKPQWHQQLYPHEVLIQHVENEKMWMDTTQGGSACVSGGNLVQIEGNMGCIWPERKNVDNNIASATSSNSTNDTKYNTANAGGLDIVEESYTETKETRSPMSPKYASSPWNKEDAAKALAVETALMSSLKNESLMICFPDPELTMDMVKNFHPGIENVYFHVSSSPRYCFVQLAENVNPDETIKELSKIDFGNGKLFVEKKSPKEEVVSKPEAIDPYSLYIGNLPTDVDVTTVKEKFPTASRVDVGFLQRMKFSKYAFIRYKSVDDAIEAYKLNHDLRLESRSLTVRFRRVRGPIGLPGESRPPRPSKSSRKEANKQKKEKEKNDGTLKDKPQWHQQLYPHELILQHVENEKMGMDTTQGGSACVSGHVTNNIASATSSNSTNDTKNNTANAGGLDIVEEPYTKTKVKRRPMSVNYASRPWNKEDAAKALAVETAHTSSLKNESLIICFPDPELTKDIVKNFHPGIENVYFHDSCNPRYCFVQLAENVNPDEAIKELSKIDFGNGKLFVEKKHTKEEEEEVLTPESIDPYSLYIGNLPTNVNVATLKEKFPTASRVDVGFAQRMRFSRYAFIRYASVDDAIEAYKLNHDLLLESRSLIVRFRRVRGSGGLPGESRLQRPAKTPKEEAN